MSLRQTTLKYSLFRKTCTALTVLALCLFFGNFSYAFNIGSPVDFASDQSMQKSRQTVKRSNGSAVEATLHRTKLEFANLKKAPEKIVGSTSGWDVLSFYKKGSARMWDLNSGVQYEVPLSRDDAKGEVVILAESKKAILFAPSGEIFLVDLLMGDRLKLGKYQPQVLAVSSQDGKLIVSADENGKVNFWDLSQIDLLRGIKRVDKSTRLKVRSVDLPGQHNVSSLSVSPDNEMVAVGNYSGVRVHSVKTGEVLHEFDGLDGVQKVQFFSPLGTLSLLLAGDKKGNVNAWHLKDGSSVWEREVFSSAITSFGCNDKLKVLSVSNDRGDVAVLDAWTGKKKSWFTVTNRASIAKALPVQDGGMVLSVCSEGVLRVHDTNSKKAVLTGVTTESGWVVLDTKGRFDGAQESLGDAKWLVDDFSLDLTKFANMYYEPGLLIKYMDQSIPMTTRGLFDVSAGIPLPPSISKMSFLNADRKAGEPVQILIAAKDVGAKVEDIELYHNGKRMPSSSVLVNKEQNQGTDVSVRAKVYQVTPTVGKNTFRAYGVGLGKIEGPTDELNETFFGSEVPSELHILSVGIDRYSLPGLNLSYATADATAVSNHLYENGGMFSNVRRMEVFDKDATRKNIEKHLKRIAEKTSPNDTLVIYLAGHGIADNDEWFFLPHDVPGVSPDEISKYGINSSLISDVLLEAPAQKVFLLIDSCYAGKAVSKFDEFQLRRVHHLMGRNSGVGIFTAARADQEAAESKVLGHGLFTAALLKGLGGEADLLKKDARVSVKELMDFSEKLIPAYSLDFLKVSQTPVAYFSGNDFPVSSYQ